MLAGGVMPPAVHLNCTAFTHPCGPPNPPPPPPHLVEGRVAVEEACGQAARQAHAPQLQHLQVALRQLAQRAVATQAPRQLVVVEAQLLQVGQG